MSEKDSELINLAYQTTEWDEIEKLEDQAESENAKQILHSREIYLYHREEGSAGLI